MEKFLFIDKKFKNTYDMNGSFGTVVVSAQAAFCVLETVAMFAVIVAVAETNRYHYEYRLFPLIGSLYFPIDFFHRIQIKHLIEYIQKNAFDSNI